MPKPVPLTDDFIKAGFVTGWLTGPIDGPGRSDTHRALIAVAWVLAALVGIVIGTAVGLHWWL